MAAINSLAIEDILVDVGASSREEAMEVYGIRPGAPIMPALKDEAEHLAVEVVGAFAAQEEVGTRGATVTAQQVQPHMAIVFEGSPADDFYFRPGIAQGSLRSGVQIRLTGRAVPVLVLGIPSRYVHSHYNFCAAEAVDAAVKMAVEVRMAVEVIRGRDEEWIGRLKPRG